jgi:hypothetical protein
MKQGSYGGFTYGSPYGFGGGLYVDSDGNLYPQAYVGSSRLGVSGGYSNDLEGLLTGLSVGGTLGPLKKVGPNVGTSGGATGFGFGTPGGGATYGFGPIPMKSVLDFRPRTDEFGQPFPGSEMPALSPGNNPGDQNIPPASANPVLKFFESFRPTTDEIGNPFPGAQSSGGVLKYGAGSPQSSEDLARLFPDLAASSDPDVAVDASPDIRRLASRIVQLA